MNDEHTHHDELHLHADPDTQRIESLLDAMGRADRDAMSTEAQSRVLDSVSQVFAPAPIAIERGSPPEQASGASRWNLRMAAAAAIATFATLGIVVSQPWKLGNQGSPTNPTPNTGAWTLASFEQDLDAFFALEDHDTGEIEEGVASWELWAQTIDTDFSTDSLADELGFSTNDDGAL
jgi:hypothetical protein